MTVQEIKELDNAALLAKVEENTARIRTVRKSIARIKTIIRERELNQ